jgi:hypothetical protein
VCKKTLGYIVVDRNERPLVWYEVEQRFYQFGAVAAASMWARGQYEAVRKCIGTHYKTINRQCDEGANVEMLRPFMSLSIVSLRSPMPIGWK